MVASWWRSETGNGTGSLLHDYAAVELNSVPQEDNDTQRV